MFLVVVVLNSRIQELIYLLRHRLQHQIRLRMLLIIVHELVFYLGLQHIVWPELHLPPIDNVVAQRAYYRALLPGALQLAQLVEFFG